MGNKYLFVFAVSRGESLAICVLAWERRQRRGGRISSSSSSLRSFLLVLGFSGFLSWICARVSTGIGLGAFGLLLLVGQSLVVGVRAWFGARRSLFRCAVVVLESRSRRRWRTTFRWARSWSRSMARSRTFSELSREFFSGFVFLFVSPSSAHAFFFSLGVGGLLTNAMFVWNSHLVYLDFSGVGGGGLEEGFWFVFLSEQRQAFGEVFFRESSCNRALFILGFTAKLRHSIQDIFYSKHMLFS